MISSLELAKLCGVSQGTVDRALHGRPGISAKTKERILQVSREHGYMPNPAAMEMMYGASNVVGILIPSLNSVFYMDIVDAIKRELDKTGLRIMASPFGSADQAGDVLRDFAARKSRAAILIAPRPGVTVPEFITTGMPVCSLLYDVQGPGVIRLFPDEVKAGRTAAEYLRRRGHRQVAHFTYPETTGPIRDRAAGFTRGIGKKGTCLTLQADADDATVLAAVRQSGVTAVFCHNDWLALRLIRLLNAAGLRVPDDVSVMGVDDSPTFNSLYPDITTLAYPRENIARAITRVIAGKKPGRIADLEVVERNTVRSLDSRQ